MQIFTPKSQISSIDMEKMLSKYDSIGCGNITDEDSPIVTDAMISVQNGRLMFVASLKIGTMVGLLETEDPRLNLDQRRQRKPDLSRIPGMSEYLRGPSWAYSAITVALTGSYSFIVSKRPDGKVTRQGQLTIPRGFKSRCVIIDGQHRFLSLRATLGLEPSYTRYALPYEKQQQLAHENICAIFYVFDDDKTGIEWSQQYFHDLNCLGVSASRSLGIKFDRSKPINVLSVRIAERAVPFSGRTEFEDQSCGIKNSNLFTLSAIKNANRALLGEVTNDNIQEKYDTALEYWNTIGEQFEEWTAMPGYEVRDRYVHGHGVILSALGLVGASPINENNNNYDFLKRLRSIDWRRWETHEDGAPKVTDDGSRIPNKLWNGLALNGSKIQNTTSNVRNSAIYIKIKLGFQISNKQKNELFAVQKMA